MIIECSSCGARYKYDESKLEGAATKKVKCAKCKGVIEILNPVKAKNRTPAPANMEKTYSAITSEAPAAVDGDPEQVGKTTTKVKRETLLADAARVSDQYLKMPESRKLSLAVISGNNSGEIFQIGTPKTVIGRGESDITIKDLEASRQHARIDVMGERVVLRDLDSTNGTFVNEQRITATNLENHSEFRIGTTVFMLIITDME